MGGEVEVGEEIRSSEKSPPRFRSARLAYARTTLSADGRLALGQGQATEFSQEDQTGGTSALSDPHRRHRVRSRFALEADFVGMVSSDNDHSYNSPVSYSQASLIIFVLGPEPCSFGEVLVRILAYIAIQIEPDKTPLDQVVQC